MLRFLKMKWLFNKNTGLILLFVIILIVIAVLINIAGVRAAGNIQNWMLWLKAHSLIFFIWRIFLYVCIGYGWWWMRRRVIKRESYQVQAKVRFRRSEVSAICALLALEISNLIM